MSETATAAPAEAVAVAKPETASVAVATTKTKGKPQTTGDLLMDIAVETENLTKSKALVLADQLFDSIETGYIKLGGVLKVIKVNTWTEGYADFDTFVLEKFGFKARKADYLMQIYDDLVTKQIPWAKVQHLGWSKLKDLSPILTLENLDEWVAKAEKLTVLELQAALKAKNAPETPDKPVDEFVPFKLKVKPDQKAMIDAAIAKAKGELNTEFDAVALENICAAYASGAVAAAKVDTSSIEAFVASCDSMKLLEAIAAKQPDWDISVQPAKPAESTGA